MKISVSVSGRFETNAHTVQCCAELESETFDQPLVERLVQAARQCDAIVRSAGHDMPEATSNQAADQAPGQPGGEHAGNGSGRKHGSGGLKRLATEKQVKAIRAMASRQGIQLAGVIGDRFGVSELSELSIKEASTLID